METALLIVRLAAIVLITLAFIALVVGALRVQKKIGQASEDLSRFLKTADESCVGLTSDTRTTLNDIDRLVVGVANTAERIDKLAEGTEHLVNGAHIAYTAARALKSSTAGLVSVLEGVKQGINTLCGSQESDKGGTSDEQ